MQWKLYYGEPILLQNGAIGCEEGIKLIDATNYETAQKEVDRFMGLGGVVVNERHYKRIFVKLTSGVISITARQAADAFARHRRAHPGSVPYEDLTPLQQRMQSGGAEAVFDVPPEGLGRNTVVRGT